VKLGGSLKGKCLSITVSSGPFESKVFAHYNCCCGPLWKQSSPLIYYSCYWGPIWKGSKPTYTLHLKRRLVVQNLNMAWS